MAHKPKKLMEVCSSQVACDGGNVLEKGMICGKCKDTIHKRAVAAAKAKLIEPQLMGLE